EQDLTAELMPVVPQGRLHRGKAAQDLAQGVDTDPPAGPSPGGDDPLVPEYLEGLANGYAADPVEGSEFGLGLQGPLRVLAGADPPPDLIGHLHIAQGMCHR